MSDTARPKSSGDELSNEEINGDLPVVVNAGETINGGTLPVAIYMDDTDNEIKACDADDQAALEFIGFAISNSTDGNPITFQKDGVVAGFSGLDIGKKYYVQDDKTIGTSKGTYEILVGVAISATQILILRGSFQYIGTDSLSASNAGGQASDTSAIPTGTRFIIVDFNGYSNDSGNIDDRHVGQALLVVGFLTSSSMKTNFVNAGDDGVTCSIAGSTLTVTTVGMGFGGGREAKLLATVYYFN